MVFNRLWLKNEAHRLKNMDSAAFFLRMEKIAKSPSWKFRVYEPIELILTPQPAIELKRLWLKNEANRLKNIYFEASFLLM